MACGPTCACLGESFACLGSTHPEYAAWCASAATDPVTVRRRAHVLGRSRIAACGRPAPLPPTPAVRSRFAQMQACPNWTKATDCGCGVNRCALGKGDRGMVSHHDCFACLGVS